MQPGDRENEAYLFEYKEYYRKAIILQVKMKFWGFARKFQEFWHS